MKSLEQRRKDTFDTAMKLEKRGRHYKAAAFLLEAAFLSDDDKAYEAYMARAKILEGIGFKPKAALNAAYECALASIPPDFDRSLAALYELAEYYGRRGKHDMAGAVMRDAHELVFVFETDFNWDDPAAIELAKETIAVMADEQSRLFQLSGRLEEPAPKDQIPEDTLSSGEIWLNVQPEPGIV